MHEMNDPALWVVSDAEKRANGSSSAWLTGGDSKRPVGQAPRTDIAFDAGYGVSPDKLTPEELIDKMMKIELNIRPTPENTEFVSMCTRINARLIKWGAENSQRLFRQPMSEEFVSKLLRPLIKASPPGEPVGGQPAKTYPPQFRVKINTKEFATEKDGRSVPNTRKTQVFVATSDATYKRGSAQDLRRGCDVVCIVEIPSIWVSGMSFGFNVVATKILVFPNSSRGDNSGLMFALPAPMTMRDDEEVASSSAVGGGSAAGESAIEFGGGVDDNSGDMQM